MRREALRPIADFMRGRDQRQIALLDVACGTGRFLRDLRLTYPAMQLTGLDLSAAYIAEASRHMGDLRPARWLAANAEAIPLADASQDIVTSVFLFHELPPAIRRRIAAEMARVLKPGATWRVAVLSGSFHTSVLTSVATSAMRPPPCASSSNNPFDGEFNNIFGDTRWSSDYMDFAYQQG